MWHDTQHYIKISHCWLFVSHWIWTVFSLILPPRLTSFTVVIVTIATRDRCLLNMVCVNCFCYRPIWSFFWWGWPHHKCPDVWLKIIPPCCCTTTVSVMWRIVWKRWYDTHEMYQPSWSGDWAASSYLCVNTILEMNTVQGLTCSAVPALVSLQSLNTCMLG